MKIFVTGATGFIGKNFCKKALKKGHFIYAPTRQKNKFKHQNLKWLLGDFSKNWKYALSNSDLLIHFATSGIKSDFLKDIYEVNVFKSLSLIKNALANKCKNWLIISTSSEYGLKNKKTKFNIKTNRIPETNYGLSKAIFSDCCIKFAKQNKCKVRILRLFPVYGKGENNFRLYPSFKKSIKKKINFYVNNPNEIRDFTNINYATSCILDAINLKKEKFSNYQIKHISKNNIQSVGAFVDNLKKKYHGTNKIIYNTKNKKIYNHISDKKSLWKLNR